MIKTIFLVLAPVSFLIGVLAVARVTKNQRIGRDTTTASKLVVGSAFVFFILFVLTMVVP